MSRFCSHYVYVYLLIIDTSMDFFFISMDTSMDFVFTLLKMSFRRFYHHWHFYYFTKVFFFVILNISGLNFKHEWNKQQWNKWGWRFVGRKRGVRRTDDYKRNIIKKKARVKGTPYVNWAGKEISAKNTANSINIEW